MLSETSDKVAIRKELLSIHHVLAEYRQLESVPIALRLIQEMLGESHPSGYPEPDTLRCITDYLRQEKFKLRREAGDTSPLAADIQLLITRLKRLRAQAEQVRPPSPVDRSPHEWSYLSYALPVFPIFFTALFFITLTITCFIEMSGITRLAILASWIFFCIFISILIKDAGSLHILITLAICLVTAYYFTANIH